MSFNIEDSFVEGLSHHRMIFEGSYIGVTYVTGCMRLFINEKVPYEKCIKSIGKPIDHYHSLASGEMIFWLLGVDYPEKWSDLVGVDEERPENTKIIYINDKVPTGTLLDDDVLILADDIYDSILKVFGVEENSRVEELFGSIQGVVNDSHMTAHKAAEDAYFNYSLRNVMTNSITMGHNELHNFFYTILSILVDPILVGRDHLTPIVLSTQAYNTLSGYTGTEVTVNPLASYKLTGDNMSFDVIELEESVDNDYSSRLMMNSGALDANTIFTWPSADGHTLNFVCGDNSTFVIDCGITNVNIEAGVIFETNEIFKQGMVDRIHSEESNVDPIIFEYEKVDNRNLELIVVNADPIVLPTSIEVEID